MKLVARRLLLATLIFLIFNVAAAAQDIAPPIPQKLVVHSNILNEDRVIWVRTPHVYESGKDPFPTLFLPHGPSHINGNGNPRDFLAFNGRMPSLIVVGTANTVRTRY